MTLRLYEDSDEFITQFSGDDRLIADYLSQEVLSGTAGRKGASSSSRSRCSTRCVRSWSAHLTGAPNAQVVLEELERRVDVPGPLSTPTDDGFASTICSETCCVSNCGRSSLTPKRVC